MRLFALDATRQLGEKIAAALGRPLDPHEEREFEDGEHKARPLVSVRGEDVYVVQSLNGGPDQSPNDKPCRLLFFLAALDGPRYHASAAGSLTWVTRGLSETGTGRRRVPSGALC